MSKKEVPLITGIHLSVPFIKEETANLEVSVRSRILKRLGSNQRNEIIFVVVSKILDHTQAEENHFTRAKGDLVHGVSTIPAKSVSQNIGKNVA